MKTLNGLSKQERIELRKKEIGGERRDRKREKHSDKFNRMFSFFYQIVRKGICDFCGSDVERDFKIIFDINGPSAKSAFKMHNTGDLSDDIITTKHPNLILAVIKGKKGWGLWKDQWVDGIIDCSFTRNEILEEFKNNNIEIPESNLIEFENLIVEKRIIYFNR